MPVIRPIFFLFLLLFFFPEIISAGEPLDAILVTNDQAFEPGKVKTLVFRIVNQSEKSHQVKVDIGFPEGIKLAIPLLPFEIIQGENKNIMATILVPSGYQAGKYDIRFGFIDQGSGATVVEKLVPIVVKKIEDISIEILASPEYVFAGDKIPASFLVRNSGNDKEVIHFEPYNCSLDSPPSLELEPGSSSVVKVLAPTDNDLKTSGMQNFGIGVSASGKSIRKVLQDVKVFPRSQVKDDLFFRFPVVFSARYLAHGREGKYISGYQFELMGKGFLDQKNQHSLEFLARGPNNFDLSFLGMHDEYYVSYSNKNIRTFVGSKSFQFTPLIESARYGTGTENSIVFRNGSDIGFLYLEPRFFRDINREYGGYGNWVIGKQNKIGLYFLTKNVNPMNQNVYLGSLSASLVPFKTTTVELEYSQSSFGDKTDFGYRIMVNSHNRFFNLNGNYFKTGSGYAGYYPNSEFYNAGLSINLTKLLSVSILTREDFNNAALDTLLSVAPYTRMFQGSLNYRIGQSFDIRSFYTSYHRKDRMLLKKFDYRTQSFNAFLNHNLNRFGYSFQGEYGKITNYLANSGQESKQNSLRLNLSLAYRLSDRLNVQGFTSFSNYYSFIFPDQKNWLWGFSAYGQLTENLRTNIQVQNSYLVEDSYQNRNLVQFSFEYDFLRKHKISLNSFYTLFQNQLSKPDYSILLNYSYQLGVPLKKTHDAGSVRGSLAGTMGEPLKGIIVALDGRTTVTGENGDFFFRSAAPGTYRLTVDRARLELNEILNLPMPLNIEVVANRESVVRLKLLEAAKITGKFITGIENPVPGILPSAPPPLGNILLVLKDSLETVRMVTNQDGTFDFPSLRPGTWSLRVLANNINSQYYLEKDQFDIELFPGENKLISIKLLPKARKIIFKSEMNVTLNKDVTVPAIPIAQKNIPDIIPDNESDIWYSVQVMAVPDSIPPGSEIFKNEKEIFEKKVDPYYKYFSGKFLTLKEAVMHSAAIGRKFPGAFVVCFRGNDLIPVKDAIKYRGK